jgi:phosphoribosylpyrophosphate synthetase
MKAGADRLVSVDLHTGQLQGFIDKSWDHLTALPIITDYLAEKMNGDTIVLSPDAGGVKRAERYAVVSTPVLRSSTSGGTRPRTTSRPRCRCPERWPVVTW